MFGFRVISFVLTSCIKIVSATQLYGRCSKVFKTVAPVIYTIWWSRLRNPMGAALKRCSISSSHGQGCEDKKEENVLENHCGLRSIRVHWDPPKTQNVPLNLEFVFYLLFISLIFSRQSSGRRMVLV